MISGLFSKIHNLTVSSSDQLTAVEKEEANFRDKIEKLREQAGESWLTFYNELQVEEEGDTSEKVRFMFYGRLNIDFVAALVACLETKAVT